jgi:hypothetical protein
MEIDHPPLMICEFLSAKSGQDPPEAFPSKNNRCIAGGRLDILPLEKQSALCLGPAHADCTLRLRARATQFAPPLGAAEALPENEYEQPEGEGTKGRKKRREKQTEAEELPTGEEQLLVEFEEIIEPEESVDKKPEPEAKEPPSQPFRRELADWMRSLFKDKDNS